MASKSFLPIILDSSTVQLFRRNQLSIKVTAQILVGCKEMFSQQCWNRSPRKGLDSLPLEACRTWRGIEFASVLLGLYVGARD